MSQDPATSSVRGPHVPVAVLGAGPAGLTAAHVLARHGGEGTVFEASDVVGGIATTVEFNGYRFDLGGHRFFTKIKPVERLWEEMLGEELLTRPRLSRIYHRGHFLAYPLEARDVMKRLGLRETMLCGVSYLAARLRAIGAPEPETFEQWVTERFGRRLYETFFKTYTEKVWGIPGSEIRAEWAAQRIKNFSLTQAALSMLNLRRRHVTTLIEEFRYPRLGPGQMWDACRRGVEERGVAVQLETPCVGIRHDAGRVTEVLVRRDGAVVSHPVDAVISSLPLRALVMGMDPPAPPEVREAALALRYRELCLVALITTQESPFPDNWIYLHDPGVRAGRVQNFGAWSEDMVLPGTTCLGAEYFCFQGDDIWEMSDADAVAMARDELARIGLLDPALVIDGVKVRVPKAYPVYDADYRAAVDTIRDWLAGIENLETCGRNGLHRYNNQDHSMWTAILATLNIIHGEEHDVWGVNADDEYIEEGEIAELPDVELVG